MNQAVSKVVTPLKNLYTKYRSDNLNVSEHTKSAQAITKKWQEEVCNESIQREVEICKDSPEKIDIIDFDNKIAFELKVSGKNIKHEFYKDLFKVLAFNENNEDRRISRFVFISEHNGIDQLENSILFQQTLKLIEKYKTLDKIQLVRIPYGK